MADTNPWSVEGWNITAQMAYVRRYGVARAEARARDAGTELGAKRPNPIFMTPAQPTDEVRYIFLNKTIPAPS